MNTEDFLKFKMTGALTPTNAILVYLKLDIKVLREG
jgi:hypothetical protein